MQFAIKFKFSSGKILEKLLQNKLHVCIKISYLTKWMLHLNKFGTNLDRDK